MNARTKRAALLLTACAALSACGGGTTTLINGTNGLDFSNGQTANLTSLAFATVGAISVAASEASYSGAGFSAQNQNLQISVQDVNTVSFTFAGTPVTLTRTGGTGPFTGTLGGSTLTATLTTNTEDPNYNSMFFGQVSQVGGGGDSETFFATGFETDPANLSGTATYSGDATLVARDRPGGVPAATNTVLMNSGTFAMAADFNAGVVTSGSMSGLDDEGNLLTLNFNPNAAISQNGFNTLATKAGTSDLTFDTLTVRGRFFNDNGEEVGGTVHGNVTGGMPSGNGTAAAGLFTGCTSGC